MIIRLRIVHRGKIHLHKVSVLDELLVKRGTMHIGYTIQNSQTCRTRQIVSELQIQPNGFEVVSEKHFHVEAKIHSKMINFKNMPPSPKNWDFGGIWDDLCHSLPKMQSM